MRLITKQDLSQFFIFLHVARNKSFTNAAKKLQISRSSVMTNIKNLEDRFSLRLINRTTRCFSLTSEGKYLFEQVIKMESLFKSTVQTLEYSSKDLKSEIIIKIPRILDIPEIHSIFSKHMHSHPGTTIHTRYEDLLGNLVEEEVDIALHIGELPDSSFYSKLVTRIPSYILASPGYLKEHGTPSHPEELSRHNCINFDHCITGNKWLLRNNQTQVNELYPLGPTLKASSERAVLSFIEDGLGIGSALSFTCYKQIAENKVTPLFKEWTYPIPLYIVYHTKSHLNKNIRCLIDNITEEIKKVIRQDDIVRCRPCEIN